MSELELIKQELKRLTAYSHAETNQINHEYATKLAFGLINLTKTVMNDQLNQEALMLATQLFEIFKTEITNGKQQDRVNPITHCLSKQEDEFKTSIEIDPVMIQKSSAKMKEIQEIQEMDEPYESLQQRIKNHVVDTVLVEQKKAYDSDIIATINAYIDQEIMIYRAALVNITYKIRSSLDQILYAPYIPEQISESYRNKNK